MSNIPSPGQIYRHFKGNLYRIVTLAQESETGEMLVIYQALYGKYQVYARALSGFTQRLDRHEYPDAEAEFRFEPVKELVEAPQRQGEESAEKEERAVPVLSPQERPEEIPQTGGQEDFPQEESTFVQEGEGQKEWDVDPLLLEFLDARTYEERLKILSALQPRITDSMLNVMAVAVDVEIRDGDTQERFDELRACLSTRQRYESRSSRLR